MPLETLQAQSYEQLSNDLDGLSQRALAANIRDPEQALQLARLFETWASRARAVCGEWSGTFLRLARDWVRELNAGLPAPKAMEQILRALRQVHRLLEKEQKGEIEKETDAPPFAHAPRSAREENAGPKEHLYVRPEDQGLFQLFLHEAPAFLSGIQSDLQLLSSGQKADLQQLYQIFRVLTGQWGFLGFLQMRQLCQAGEAVLEPLLAGKSAPSASQWDVLLKAIGSCRSQVDRIARGLPKDYVELWDAAPVLEELRFQRPSAPAGGAAVLESPARPAAAPSWEGPLTPPPLGVEDLLGVRDEQIESLLELLAELLFSQSSFLEEALSLNLKGKSAADAAHMAKLARQVRDQLLSLRMVSLKPLFDRIAWDLAQFSRRSGKAVSLAVESPDIQVDKSLLPQLAGPLSQLLQNAVDHGIELPEERVRDGKPQEGKLKVKVFQQGGSVVLEVEDDGRGLDLEQLRKKGRELGFLGDGRATQARVMEMVFKPGVTTLPGLGDGRGLGLDQVEAQVENLYGSIRVQSKAGQGCKFTLKVPRTQALIEGWVVEAAGKRYLLPLSQVRKITHPAPAGAEREVPVEEAAAPLIDLGRWLGDGKGDDAPKFSVHVEAGSDQFRLQVDEVHGKQQVLVRKKTGGGPEKRGVRAEALLPDGKVVWVLDTREFAESKD